ncbi:MAG: hypothetical protein AAB402_04670 [Patescibacteria group bacterium]
MLDPEHHDRDLYSRITAEAAQYYDARLPYHNFEHVRSVLAHAERIIADCRSEGVPIDAEVVRYAVLFHDADYAEDHRAKGYDSKEAYAAALATTVLEPFDVDPHLIQRVQSTIMATHHAQPFSTNEEKAIRAADLANMAGLYEDFLESNRRLKAETEILSGTTMSWAEWKAGTKTTVEWYLNQDIRLTSHHDDEHGFSVFHQQAQKNLQRFLADETTETT